MILAISSGENVGTPFFITARTFPRSTKARISASGMPNSWDASRSVFIGSGIRVSARKTIEVGCPSLNSAVNDDPSATQIAAKLGFFSVMNLGCTLEAGTTGGKSRRGRDDCSSRPPLIFVWEQFRCATESREPAAGGDVSDGSLSPRSSRTDSTAHAEIPQFSSSSPPKDSSEKASSISLGSAVIVSLPC